MHTTNCFDTFIAVAPDCAADRGTPPKESDKPSIALLTYRMIRDNPYVFTSDDVIFTVFADRKGIAPADREAARQAYFSKGQACLRASDLGKRYGWGIHADAKGRVALYGVETPEYLAFAGGAGVATITRAMRSSKSA